MRRVFYMMLLMSASVCADTIDHYMNIANNIPQMEMKADPQAQAWARSARNVLLLTSESIAETLLLANDTAKASGSPLFCLPAGMQLNPTMLNELIQQTYREISSQQSDKDRMTVSQVALLGVRKQYPCSPTQNPTPIATPKEMMHVSASE
ncbi:MULTISPECIES: phosphatase [Legionella]|uniref:Phosphatase n=1 Tax=Legionella septentrionalis TaxID=2498109 RepID=A0A433JI92_9GAMM|nr:MULTISPECIES: phosphatase [Legionella]MCP0914527.1 phosphatase [Legionella sp. 27cVA30]RUQ84998.1 phosphatase [Legionella septentrionalis]RUR02366.1 phosphatase [Legionella septentrionalis]RUR10309.1 phosphatase [Legionella septentrionalis]RUR17023.1 phosphatase [Legionella septentrionalis]